jgi:hypothetical protein
MDGIPLTKVKILCNSPRYDAMPLPLDKLNDVKTYQAFSAPKSKAFKIRSQKLKTMWQASNVYARRMFERLPFHDEKI